MTWAADEYASMEDVLRDIDLVCDDAVASVENLGDEGDPSTLVLQHGSALAKIRAFKQKAHKLVQQERILPQDTDTSSIALQNDQDAAVIKMTPKDGKIVLTVLGNGARQLFSSFQKPIHLDGEAVYPELRENGLPTGIYSTRLLTSSALESLNAKKRVSTLGDVFPTPASLPQMQPPKPSKFATTRSSSVGWYQPDDVDPAAKYNTYPRQGIAAGQWLDYSNSTSAGLKRKRDRALSLSGKPPVIESEGGESEAEKLESLFRSAYSSFAPTKDDAAAIVPGSQLGQMWWQRNGEKAFERLVKMTDDVHDGAAELEAARNEMAEFEQVVDKWDPDAVDPSLLELSDTAEKPVREQEVDEVLQGISELLETLNSYQRIRHISLSVPSRPAGLLSAPDTTSQGTPTKPSEPELATYEMLKSQITILVATLPPYAVAKLDSTKLGDLGISTRIPVTIDDHKGVMEEDDATTRAKVAALSAASNTNSRAAPAPQHRNSNASAYGNQYAASRTSSVGSAYQAHTQTPARAVPAALPRPPASAPSHYQQRNPSSGYRPNGYATPSYPQTTQRPMPQYAQGVGLGSSYGQGPRTPSFPQRAPYQGYQSRVPPASNYPYAQPPPVQTPKPAMSNGHTYTYNSSSTPYAGQASTAPKMVFSPGTPASQFTPHAQPASHLPPSQSARTPTYPPSSTPMTGPDRRPSAYMPPLSANMTSLLNGGSRPSASPVSAGPPSGIGGWSTHLDSKQQADIMDKQRAQLAQQQGSQTQARHPTQQAPDGPMTSPNPQVNGNAVAAGS